MTKYLVIDSVKAGLGGVYNNGDVFIARITYTDKHGVYYYDAALKDGENYLRLLHGRKPLGLYFTSYDLKVGNMKEI